MTIFISKKTIHKGRKEDFHRSVLNVLILNTMLTYTFLKKSSVYYTEDKEGSEFSSKMAHIPTYLRSANIYQVL